MDNPADLWRIESTLKDPERFFRRSVFEVGDADMLRWKIACTAFREIVRSYSAD